MKKILVFLVTILAIIGLTSCGKEHDLSSTATEGVLVVGMECNYAPFNWTETKNTESNVEISNIPGAYVEGYDVQIAKKIAEALNLTLQIKSLEWDALIPSLKHGEIDIIIAGMSPTDERKLSISFSDAYYISDEVMLVSATGTFATATSLDDFAGARVAGQLGTLYADLVPQVVAKGAIAGTNLNTVPALVNQIKNNVLDATIVELPVAQGLCSQDSSLAYVTFTEGNGFSVSPEDVTVSIGVRKECSFLTDINAALAGISTADRTSLMLAAVKNAGE